LGAGIAPSPLPSPHPPPHHILYCASLVAPGFKWAPENSSSPFFSEDWLKLFRPPRSTYRPSASTSLPVSRRPPRLILRDPKTPFSVLFRCASRRVLRLDSSHLSRCERALDSALWPLLQLRKKDLCADQSTAENATSSPLRSSHEIERPTSQPSGDSTHAQSRISFSIDLMSTRSWCRSSCICSKRRCAPLCCRSRGMEARRLD
jgi:hypothetical protein